VLVRRLAFVAALLFFVAMVSSAVVRREENRRQATAPAAAPPAAPIATVEAQLPAERRVQARVGEIVNLQVRSEEPQDVSIPALGVTDVASADVPALLEFVADQPGRFAVVADPSGRRLGTVVVDAAR
jgi:hypothetical protein